jgi:hypothetical protein
MALDFRTAFILEVKMVSRSRQPILLQNPSARISFLSDDDVRRLIKAANEIDDEHDWDGDLYRLVLGLAATGARFTNSPRHP